MVLDWNVELALLEELETVVEVTVVVAEDASLEVEHEGGTWVVLDVAGTATLVAEKVGVEVDVVVILAGGEVAAPWRLLTK